MWRCSSRAARERRRPAPRPPRPPGDGDGDGDERPRGRAGGRDPRRRLPAAERHRPRDGPAGDAAWRAFFDGAELALLEERVADPPRPPLENRYDFEKGALFYVEGEQAAGRAAARRASRRASPSSPSSAARRRRAQCASSTTVAVPLAPDRIQAIQRRVAELASAARDERSAQKVAP